MRIVNHEYVRQQGRRIRAASMRKCSRRGNVRWEDDGGSATRTSNGFVGRVAQRVREYVRDGDDKIESLADKLARFSNVTTSSRWRRHGHLRAPISATKRHERMDTIRILRHEPNLSHGDITLFILASIGQKRFG